MSGWSEIEAANMEWKASGRENPKCVLVEGGVKGWGSIECLAKLKVVVGF
jgi:hypothetical protein